MPPAVTLTAPHSPSRSRSVSQPIPEDAALDTLSPLKSTRSTVYRSQSSNSIRNASSTSHGSSAPTPNFRTTAKGRARSSSLVTVTEVGGDDPDNVVDRLGVGNNENADWVNAPGAWMIHPLLILLGKMLIDAIPGMTQDVSWTIVNLGYITVSFLIFHHNTGIPFESNLTSAGAYDDLTLWEQIDSGAQYTPSKKWLTSVPIGLFLISTHYTKYDYTLFCLNFAALIFVLFPKLPVLHRLRFHFAVPDTDGAPTPYASRPPSPFMDRSTKLPSSSS
ncbi:hypothetical protein I316_01189 [Kwoniella heveanensis BCC8398]|uniref:Uncharacterized protein n=1 Tax=Kwoniella heveanensis BCC8398 TaxID=1296120 RepID=A0A1B9H1Y9_9TREE|nr:hypothetical protein I316_01189 [Kwoniella heveanensis BCC8398]